VRSPRCSKLERSATRRETALAAAEEARDNGREVEFRVLGPLEVSAAGRPLPLGGRKQRTLLALLLLHPNELVPRDRLIDALWGEDPPAEADASLRVYVARLRKLLAVERNGRPSIDTSANGYVLRVDPETVDVERFRRLVARGDFAQALELWRGRALADLTDDDWARHQSDVLEELRLGALEERIDADLAAGRHAELVSELEELVAGHPYRERLVGQLMVALYRSGRQPEALEAYRRLRTELRDRFGLDPTPSLRELERRILVQDPALEVRRAQKRRISAPIRRRRRTMAVVIATLGAAFVVGAAQLAGSQQRVTSQQQPLAGNSVVAIDADSTEVIGEVPVGGRPEGVALGEGSVWVGNTDERTLLRIDPHSRVVVDTIGLGVPPSGVTVGGGSVWVVSRAANVVLQVDPTLNEVVATIDLPDKAVDLACCPHQVAFARGALWVSFWSSLVRIDPAKRKVVRTPFGYVRWIAATDRALWAVTGIEADRVQRLEPLGDAMRLGPDQASGGLKGIAATERDVWTHSFRGTLSRIEAETSRLDISAALGRMVYGFAATRDSLWVVTLSGEVVRIDPVTGRRLKKLWLGGLYPPYAPNVIAAGPDDVWTLVLER
jgi:DNA-binding SARP family transcriptional activator/streptogramin lyase